MVRATSLSAFFFCFSLVLGASNQVAAQTSVVDDPVMSLASSDSEVAKEGAGKCFAKCYADKCKGLKGLKLLKCTNDCRKKCKKEKETPKPASELDALFDSGGDSFDDF